MILIGRHTIEKLFLGKFPEVPKDFLANSRIVHVRKNLGHFPALNVHSRKIFDQRQAFHTAKLRDAIRKPPGGNESVELNQNGLIYHRS